MREIGDHPCPHSIRVGCGLVKPDAEEEGRRFVPAHVHHTIGKCGFLRYNGKTDYYEKKRNKSGLLH